MGGYSESQAVALGSAQIMRYTGKPQTRGFPGGNSDARCAGRETLALRAPGAGP